MPIEAAKPGPATPKHIEDESKEQGDSLPDLKNLGKSPFKKKRLPSRQQAPAKAAEPATEPTPRPRLWAAKGSEPPPRSLHLDPGEEWKGDLDSESSEISRVGARLSSSNVSVARGSADVPRNLAPEQQKRLRQLDQAIESLNGDIQALLKERPNAASERANWERQLKAREDAFGPLAKRWNREVERATAANEEPSRRLRQEVLDARNSLRVARNAVKNFRENYPLKEYEEELQDLQSQRWELLTESAAHFDDESVIEAPAAAVATSQAPAPTASQEEEEPQMSRAEGKMRSTS